MGTYNTINAHIICPHCGNDTAVEIETRLGDTRHMRTFTIGDRYVWMDGKSVKNGGRPAGGSLAGEGYTVCPRCQRDFFVKVTIVGDVITAVEPDGEKQGYIRPLGNEQGK